MSKNKNSSKMSGAEDAVSKLSKNTTGNNSQKPSKLSKG